jgi:hypothetical protein
MRVRRFGVLNPIVVEADAAVWRRSNRVLEDPSFVSVLGTSQGGMGRAAVVVCHRAVGCVHAQGRAIAASIPALALSALSVTFIA